MPCCVSSGRSSSCRTRTYFSLSTRVGRSLRSMTFHRGHSGKREVVGDLGVRQDDDVVPAQPALGPAVVILDELAQRVAGFAGLADRVDLVLVAATLLPPGLAVVPDVAALDLEADDAGALDRDDEVDLVILEVVGDTLAGDHPVIGLQLVEQGLVDLALGGVGEPWRFVGGDGHTSSTRHGAATESTPSPRLNNVGTTAVGHTSDRDSCRWPDRTVRSSARIRGGIMRGRGVIAGVIAVCGAVALSGPARADQFDFITAARQHGGELRAGARHDRYRQGALPRPAERGGAAGRARQAAGDGVRAGGVGERPDVGGEQHVPRHQDDGGRLGTRRRLHGPGEFAHAVPSPSP